MEGGTRPGAVPLTARAVAGVLLAAFSLVAGGVAAVRSTIGAGTSSVSLPGTGIVVTHAGDAGTLDAAGAADGAVVAIVGGAPVLTTISSGTGLPDAAGVADGAALVVAGGAQAWVAPSGGLTLSTLYADDCSAEAGSVLGGETETAVISGTDAASTATITGRAAGGTHYYGTDGISAARIVCPIPAGAVSIVATLQVTGVSGSNSNGYRYLAMGLRNARTDGAQPTRLWGVGCSDTATGGFCYWGTLMSGANAGGVSAAPVNGTQWFAADRWLRAAWRPEEAWLAHQTAAGAGAGLRPAGWTPYGSTGAVHNNGTLSLPDTGVATSLAVWLQSFGAATASVTFGLTIYVVSR